jgi:hypothetical protein
MNETTKDLTYKGKTFTFHNPNGFGWTLLWSNGWELVDEAAKAMGWKRTNHGRASYGHVYYRLA